MPPRPSSRNRQEAPPENPPQENEEKETETQVKTTNKISAMPAEIIGQNGSIIRSNTATAVKGFRQAFQDSPYSQEFVDEPQGFGGYYLNIAQSQSQPVLDEYKDEQGNSWLGQLYLSGSSLNENAEEFDSPAQEIIAVPIAGAAKRQKWVQKGNERSLQCWAVGAKFSELVGEGNPGGECKECEFSKWITDANGKRITGCNRTYSYVLYIPQWEEICVWDLSSTSAAVGKEFLKWCQARGWANFAVSIWGTQVTGTDYGLSDDGTAILLADENKVVASRQVQQGARRPTTGNRWFAPECQILEGTLEENGIYIPMEGMEEATEEADDDLPF